VERTAAILDGFELSDADAPIVSDICRKLGGIALAIELAAARLDAFSIPQLSVLLNDRFHILKKGKRTAQPRHQSLAAALDWSYEFLTEVERIVLRRLSVFAGTFTLGSVVAVAGDDITDVVEAVANLVAKSLISADVGGVAVQYRLLETTRAYAMQKLIEMGEFEGYARRHAEHYLEWFKRGEDDWWTLSAPEWLEDYGRRIDDVRNALNWAFSPNGDALIGVALTIASIQSWLVLSLMHECRERIERALASLAAQPTHSEREEMSLLTSLGLAQLYTEGPQAKNDGAWAKALQLAEKLDDIEYQVRALWGGAVWRFYVGEYREALAYAKKCCVVAAERGNATLELIGDDVAGAILFYLGNYTDARHHLDRAVSYHLAAGDSESVGHRASSRITLSNILWIQGFPDQAVCSVQVIVDEARAVSNAILLCNTLAQAACPISLYVGDLTGTERSVAMLLEYSAKHALSTWSAVGRCWKGALLLAQGDRAGLAVLRTALDGLRGARVAVLYTMSLGTLAHGLGAAGQFVEAHQAIDEALERTERNEERWCMAELLRIKGEILRLDGSADADQAAEDCFQQSLDWARRQEALSWELRAATSLAKLWRQNGKRAEANELLSYVYNRFTEGFDTVDLRTARALIDEFHKGQS